MMRAVILALAAVAAACSSATPPVPLPAETVTFPLHFAAGSRYPLDAAGKPFMLRGDNPSSLAVMLAPEEVAHYLDDRKARGFNTILFEVIEHQFTTRPPYNRMGHAPFRSTRPNANGSKCVNSTIGDCWDFSAPDEAYWSNVDSVIAAATQRGFLVMLFAAYIGYKGGAEGWFQDMQANGPEVLEGYGKFLAGRYQHYDNILWVQGGDYIPADRTLVDAVANGIRSVLPNALQTVHTSRGHAAMDAWPNTPWLNVNNIYTSFVVHDAAREQAARTGTPFFLIEAVYENPTPLFPTNPSATAAQVRSQAYEAVLGGAFGQIMGTNPLWYFGPGWQKGLDSGGARSLSQLYRLMSSHAWWLLQPDADALVRTGQSATAFAAGALGSDRSFALVYVPETRRVGVNLAQLAGPSVTAHWYDPTEGTLVKAVDAPLANSGVHDFDPPGRNSARDRDWVLVLESSPRSLSDQ